MPRPSPRGCLGAGAVRGAHGHEVGRVHDDVGDVVVEAALPAPDEVLERGKGREHGPELHGRVHQLVGALRGVVAQLALRGARGAEHAMRRIEDQLHARAQVAVEALHVCPHARDVSGNDARALAVAHLAQRKRQAVRVELQARHGEVERVLGGERVVVEGLEARDHALKVVGEGVAQRLAVGEAALEGSDVHHFETYTDGIRYLVANFLDILLHIQTNIVGLCNNLQSTNR